MSKMRKEKIGGEEARPLSGMKKMDKVVAGIDIGSQEIVVCIERAGLQIVRTFGSYTVDLQTISAWLIENEVQGVAMESTGVYWIALFEELENKGIECQLIS